MFFSISPNDFGEALLDEIYGCFKYIGIPIDTVMNMPVQNRKYFISRINKNVGNLRLCTLMEGHKSPVYTDASYVKYDISDVKEAYMAAIPDLSLENVETKVYTSDVRREMENKIQELEHEVQMKDDKVELLFKEFAELKKNITWEDVKKEY